MNALSGSRQFLDDPRYRLTSGQQESLLKSTVERTSLTGTESTSGLWLVGDIGYAPLPHPDVELSDVGTGLAVAAALHPIWFLAFQLRVARTDEDLGSPAGRSLYLARRYVMLAGLGLCDVFEGGYYSSALAVGLDPLGKQGDLEVFAAWLAGKGERCEDLDKLTFGYQYVKNEIWQAEVLNVADSWLAVVAEPQTWWGLPSQLAGKA